MKPKVYLSQLTPKQMLQWYGAELENFKLAQQAELSRMDRILSVRLSNALEKRGLPSVSCYDDMNDLINRMFPDDRPQQIVGTTATPVQSPVVAQPAKHQPAQPEPSVVVDLAARDRYDKDAPEILRLIKFIRANTMSYDDYANGEVAVKCIELFMLIQKHKLDLLSQMLGPYSGYYETCLYIRKNYTTINEAAVAYKSEEEHKQIVAERQQQRAAQQSQQSHRLSPEYDKLLAGAQRAMAERNATTPSVQQPAQPQPVDDEQAMKALLAQLP